MHKQTLTHTHTHAQKYTRVTHTHRETQTETYTDSYTHTPSGTGFLETVACIHHSVLSAKCSQAAVLSHFLLAATL